MFERNVKMVGDFVTRIFRIEIESVCPLLNWDIRYHSEKNLADVLLWTKLSWILPNVQGKWP